MIAHIASADEPRRDTHREHAQQKALELSEPGVKADDASHAISSLKRRASLDPAELGDAAAMPNTKISIAASAIAQLAQDSAAHAWRRFQQKGGWCN